MNQLPTVEIATDQLHVREVGVGVPVLLVHHAGGSFSQYTDSQCGSASEWLAARGCRVLGFDLPGHGPNERPARLPDNYVQICQDAATSVLDAHGFESAAVVGIGFGGLVALRLAASGDPRIRCVVADSPSGVTSLPDTAWDAVPHVRSPVDDAWSQFAPRCVDEIAAIGALCCPALLIACAGTDRDGTVRSEFERMAARFQTARIHLAPRDGAPTAIASSRFFIERVEAFLAGYA